MNNRQKIESVLSNILKITSVYTEYARKNNMSYNRFLVLYAIKEVPNCTQKQIIELWGVPKQTVNTVVLDLQKDGMLELIKSEGKKEKIISITEPGHKYIFNIVDKIIKSENSAISALNDNEFKQLDSYIRIYADKFEIEVNSYE